MAWVRDGNIGYLQDFSSNCLRLQAEDASHGPMSRSPTTVESQVKRYTSQQFSTVHWHHTRISDYERSQAIGTPNHTGHSLCSCSCSCPMVFVVTVQLRSSHPYSSM